MIASPKSAGLHHVTAFAKNPQQNLEFYTSVLGLRLVKLTVNFDAPDVYHFYFGDYLGHPGTLLTFFPFPNAGRGRPGVGEVGETCFTAPEGSLGFWTERLAAAGIEAQPETRFGEERIVFNDPDGLQLAISATAKEGGEDREGVSAREALQRIGGVTLSVDGYERTAAVLNAILGSTEGDSQGSLFRFHVGGTAVDIACRPGQFSAAMGAGSVHHIAWRAADAEQQLAFRNLIVERGLNPTPVLDRSYFQSIYFREPGGITFEIATDEPGFATDEPVESLGTRLMLPPWLEPKRQEIAASLPPVKPDGSSDKPDLGFIHSFEAGAGPDAATLVLLHGTGGDENDLLPLGRSLAPGANLLSPRGKVLESGMPRYFRRLAQGVFDEADVRARAAELAGFITRAKEAYGLTGKIMALGLSNGANIAAAIMLLHPEAFDGAVLLRATDPLSGPGSPDLRGKPVLLSAGLNDPLVSPEKLERLRDRLSEAGAGVSVLMLAEGHNLSMEELPDIRNWLAEMGFEPASA